MAPVVGADPGRQEVRAIIGERKAKPAASTSRVPALDGFRAYAILGVVSVHLLGASGVLERTGGTDEGVLLWSVFGNSIDTFFIISAFVLFLPAVVRGGDLGGKATFWIGRGTRLLPAYWLVIAICLPLMAVVPPVWAVPGSTFPSPETIVVHLAFLQMPMLMFDSHFELGFGVNGPLWLISIVVSFYLLLPFVARAYYRHPLIGLGVAAAVTLGWKRAIDWTPGVFHALSDGSERFAQLIAPHCSSPRRYSCSTPAGRICSGARP